MKKYYLIVVMMLWHISSISLASSIGNKADIRYFSSHFKTGNYWITNNDELCSDNKCMPIEQGDGEKWRANQAHRDIPSPIPTPGAIWLFGSALLGFACMKYKPRNRINSYSGQEL
jgi:hypothetical protein